MIIKKVNRKRKGSNDISSIRVFFKEEEQEVVITSDYITALREYNLFSEDQIKDMKSPEIESLKDIFYITAKSIEIKENNFAVLGSRAKYRFGTEAEFAKDLANAIVLYRRYVSLEGLVLFFKEAKIDELYRFVKLKYTNFF